MLFSICYVWEKVMMCYQIDYKNNINHVTENIVVGFFFYSLGDFTCVCLQMSSGQTVGTITQTGETQTHKTGGSMVVLLIFLNLYTYLAHCHHPPDVNYLSWLLLFILGKNPYLLIILFPIFVIFKHFNRNPTTLSPDDVLNIITKLKIFPLSFILPFILSLDFFFYILGILLRVLLFLLHHIYLIVLSFI